MMTVLMATRKYARPAFALMVVGAAAFSLSGCVFAVSTTDESDLSKRVEALEKRVQTLESKGGRRR